MSGAEELLTLKLWPGGAPEKPGVRIEAETWIPQKSEKDVKRLTQVSEPTITLYRPTQPNGTAVIVCPGGGYSILAIEHEGTQVCEWLNSIGVTAVLLKYRVPVRMDSPGYEPLQDAQRAMGLVRHHAEEWGIHPRRVGILGFSAGGHLSVMTALHPNERTYAPEAALDVEDARPDFLIPVYPAYLTAPGEEWALESRVTVTEKAPPVCLIHAHDDKGRTSAAGSALLYLEYKKRGVPAELHICTQGGHGFGMRRGGQPVHDWPQRVEEWMRAMGLLTPEKPVQVKP
jgi:acetyl esterase/lipase